MKATRSDSSLRQCIYESDQWGRLLAFLKQENVFCKSRLAEAVATLDDEGSVEEAEEFNDQFLSQDSMIEYLENELKKHRKLLQKDLYGDEQVLKNIIKSQRMLGRNMQNAEEIFSRTRRRFSIYLLTLF
jgi:predicted nucleotidyltransferase